jgi:hypothetical protein
MTTRPRGVEEAPIHGAATPPDQDAVTVPRTDIVHIPVGTRLLRVVRRDDYWIVWTATHDFRLGTYLRLHHDGTVERVTARADEGDEVMLVRPSNTVVNMRSK